MEHPIRRIELAVLQTQHVLGGHAHKVMQHVAGRGVVRTVQKRWRYPQRGVCRGHTLHALLEVGQALVIQRADGFGKIPEGRRLLQVQLFGSKVRNHMWEHLHNIYKHIDQLT